jgi:hypothetical protein
MVSLSFMPISFIALLWCTIIGTVIVSGKYKIKPRPNDPQHPHTTTRYRIPILCSAGDSPPASFIYAAGGSISSVFLTFTILLEAYRISKDTNDSYPALNVISVIMGIGCSIFLSAMCVVPVKFNAAIHNNFAIAFIALGMVYQVLNLSLVIASDIGSQYSLTLWRGVCFGVNLLCCVGIITCMRLVETLVLVDVQRKAEEEAQRMLGQPPKEAPLAIKPEEEEKKVAPIIPHINDFEFSISISFGTKNKKRKVHSNPDQVKKKKRTSEELQNVLVQTWALLQYISLITTSVFFASFINPFYDQLRIISI